MSSKEITVNPIDEILQNIDNLEDVQVMDIDLDDIGNSASESAKSLLKNISELYFDTEFLKNHPNFKSRIDSELETFKILYKMRRSDEIVQDTLIKAISTNTKNASLYKSLSDIQRTIISITAKMEESTAELEKLMKEYQITSNTDESEIQVEENNNESNDSMMSRGTRDFIKRMQEAS